MQCFQVEEYFHLICPLQAEVLTQFSVSQIQIHIASLLFILYSAIMSKSSITTTQGDFVRTENEVTLQSGLKVNINNSALNYLSVNAKIRDPLSSRV